MASNGPLFLERTKHGFLEDLMGTFGQRADGFTEELKVLLFELWVRARSRPPFPEHRPEPTDQMRQAEFVERLARSLEEMSFRAEQLETSQDELRKAFVKSVQTSITTGAGIVRNDKEEALSLHLDPTNVPDKFEMAKVVDEVLQVDGLLLEKQHDAALAEVTLALSPTLANSASGVAQIPELEATTDDDQDRLEKRLEKLGVIGPHNWVPVFQHTETGARAGLNIKGGERFYERQINTLLVHDGMNWLFPRPRPVYSYDDCSHVRLWVNGVDQMNAVCTWNSDLDEVESVDVPGAVNTDQVRAVYSTFHKEYGI